MVEQWNRQCGTVDHLMVEQGNISWWSSGRYDVRTVKQRWWNSDTFDGGTVEHLMVEQRNRSGERVEQRWWNIRTPNGGTLEHLMVKE